jgi:hypothetical protein
MSVDAFVELHSRFEFGTVSHALCSSIRSLLKVRKHNFRRYISHSLDFSVLRALTHLLLFSFFLPQLGVPDLNSTA